MYRSYQKIDRRKSRVIHLGNIKVGGGAPISVQTMTNTITSDVKSTLSQIDRVRNVGADIVRVSVPDQESSQALKKIITLRTDTISLKQELADFMYTKTHYPF